MKARELRMRSTEELQSELERLKDQLFSLKFQRVVGRLENPNQIRQIKRDIARIKTILREREHEEGKS
ncbi:50S ribosomal protein L29 [Candidatus Poribacteria bacterium]|nr:50S ribosomal protein L29 [Candidatus Poribacteria bacterium]HDO76639.1 50S ribosomal protein L29 [Candidatus Poribacteria bacterium]HEX30244.1 50S ribosomal protein L29 [Candidatus Poribacteria bacterium]